LDIQSPSVDYDASSAEEGSRITDSIPLIVNSMGWVKGLGADLTQKIEDLLLPTDVFDIQPSLAAEHYGYSGAPPTSIPNARNQYQAYHGGVIADEGDSKVHIVQGIPSSTLIPGFTAADHRAMSILSYFHAVFPKSKVPGEVNQVTVRGWDTAKPLCAIPPYEVDASVALDKVVLTGAGSEDVVPEEVGRVLNGAIVGVVKCEPGTLGDYGDASINGGDTEEKTIGIPYTRHFTPPSPSSSTCVGLVLIRAVAPHLVDCEPPFPSSSSPAKPLLHVLTPLPPALLSGARVFVKGEMELPIWGMLDFRSSNEGDVAGVERVKVPYLQWGRGGEGVAGAEKRRVRRNLMRRSQM
jgi:polynucleotide 5'-hydroxyl-kinase GRC3/NOL9